MELQVIIENCIEDAVYGSLKAMRYWLTKEPDPQEVEAIWEHLLNHAVLAFRSTVNSPTLQSPGPHHGHSVELPLEPLPDEPLADEELVRRLRRLAKIWDWRPVEPEYRDEGQIAEIAKRNR